MFFFSFFAVISVAWADLCVNLDRFEADPVDSQLGQTISTNLDSSGDQVIEIVNACWTGSDLLDVFNLSDVLDWTAYRDNLSSILDVDITNELSLEELDSFITEVNILNTDEFEVLGDQYLADLNSVGGNCACYNMSTDSCYTHGTTDGEFTREKLQNDLCYNTSAGGKIPDCWFGSSSTPAELTQGGFCAGNFSKAYAYLQGEDELSSQTQAAIDDIKSLTQRIVTAYDAMFGVAVGVEDSIENISCQIDPLFDSFDALVENYTTCGFIGEAYGDFKEVGCVLLFGDMYWISYALMVIAFLAIPVVCLGFMSQTSMHFEHDDHLEKEDDGMFNLGRQLSSRMGSRMGLGLDEPGLMEGTTMPAQNRNSIEFGMQTIHDPAQPPPSAPPGGSPSWNAVESGHNGGDTL